MEAMRINGLAKHRDLLLTVAVPVLLLLPFLGKAFHMDDPLYLRVAQQILASPLNFYGFTMNWYGVEQPMYDINQNPPLLSYYLAPFGGLFGWREWVMHAAMLLPTTAAIAGIAVLARQFGAPPRSTTWIAVLNPLFFVSATTVMTDVPMLACWVWAMVTWRWGLDSGRARWFTLSAFLVGTSFLFKYFGLSLLPLLALYTLLQQPRRYAPLAYLFIPVVMVLTYEIWCYYLYAQGQFLAAFTFAEAYTETQPKNYGMKVLSTFAFLGSLGVWLLAAPELRRSIDSRSGIVGCLALVIGTIALSASGSSLPLFVAMGQGMWIVRNLFAITLVLAGLGVLGIAIYQGTRSSDRQQTLLIVWIVGTLVFVCLVNHFVNARVLLPLLPAIAILIAPTLNQNSPIKRTTVMLIATGLSLLVAFADTRLANAARHATDDMIPYIRRLESDGQIWFAGHWGLQWYMEEAGALPLDGSNPGLRPQDIVVMPSNNANLVTINAALTAYDIAREFPVFPYLSTMSREMHAGFYADYWGPLPFAVGLVPPERYRILLLSPYPVSTLW